MDSFIDSDSSPLLAFRLASVASFAGHYSSCLPFDHPYRPCQVEGRSFPFVALYFIIPSCHPCPVEDHPFLKVLLPFPYLSYQVVDLPCPSYLVEVHPFPSCLEVGLPFPSFQEGLLMVGVHPSSYLLFSEHPKQVPSSYPSFPQMEVMSLALTLFAQSFQEEVTYLVEPPCLSPRCF